MRYCVFSNSTNPLLNIKSMGYSASPMVTRYGPTRRNHFIIHYCMSGKGWFNGNPVTAGQGFLITPNMEETYFPDADDPWEFLWIVSADSRMGELFPAFCADGDTHIFSYPGHIPLRETANWIITHSNTALDSLQLLELFLRLFRHRSSPSHPGSRPYLEAAINYIDANMHRPVSVQELTAFLGISQPYLFTLFKAAFLCSPKQYILQTKLHRAQTLLADTDLPVTLVAAAVGFDDVLSFSKFFSARTGRSPTSYRKEARS